MLHFNIQKANESTSGDSSSSDEIEIQIKSVVTPTNDKQDSGIDGQ